MKIIEEFKKFVARGNVIDLAVAVIIGAAFGKIVTSLVEDVIMPPIGLVMKGMDFKDLFVSLNGKAYATLDLAKADSAPLIAYGNFLNACISFLVVAACVFALVKIINSLYRQEEAAAPPTKTETLLEEIRDLLRNRQP